MTMTMMMMVMKMKTGKSQKVDKRQASDWLASSR